MMVPNRPSAEGRLIGEQLARMTDESLERLRERFPDHAERCESCAFRRDTVPNGCLPTVMDALKCVIEQQDFFCHQGPKGKRRPLCVGYMIALSAVYDQAPGTVPWNFSHIDDASVMT